MMAYWRLVFMGLTLLLLVIALVPTGHTGNELYRDYENEAVAACLYLELEDFRFFNKPLIATSLIVFLTIYVTRVVALFMTTSNLVHEWLRILPGEFLKDSYNCTKSPYLVFTVLFYIRLRVVQGHL